VDQGKTRILKTIKMKRLSIKISSVLLLIMVNFFGCSKSEITSEEQKEEMERNQFGLTLVDQVSLNDNDDEFGIDIVATSNGYIICGIADGERPYLIAIDNGLSVLWEKTLGVTGVGGFEKIIRTTDGNYVAAGFTEIDDTDNLDVYAVKIDELGQILWEKTFGFNYIMDTTMDLIETSNGDLLIAGSKLTEPLPSNILDTKQDILVVRVDSDGGIIWSNTYGGIEDKESFASILEEGNGNILIGGSKIVEKPSNNGSIVTTQKSDALIYRITSEGQILNEKTFGSSENDGSAILHKLNNGQIVVVSSTSGSDGDVTNPNSGEWDVWLFALDNNFNITNQVNIGGFGRDSAVQLIEKDSDSDGFFLVGDTNSHLVSSTNTFSSSDFWVVSLSSSFTVLDEVTLGGSDYDGASGAILQDDKLVVVGSTNSNDGDIENSKGEWDIWVTFIEDIE